MTFNEPFEPELMTKLSNPYLIPFVGLKNGEHSFLYDVNDSFFADKEYSEIKKANVTVNLKLTKETNLLLFDFKMDGTVNVMCDRCGDHFDMPVWGERRLIASLTNDRFEEGDDIVALPASASEIDISQYLYEYIVLLIPQRRLHPDKEGKSTCNQDALNMLNNLSRQHEEDPKRTDPRWDALKNLKKN